jgi:hypothetical protein
MRHTQGLGRVVEHKCVRHICPPLFIFKIFFEEKRNLFFNGANIHLVARVQPVACTIMAAQEMKNVNQDEQTVAQEVLYGECLKFEFENDVMKIQK